MVAAPANAQAPAAAPEAPGAALRRQLSELAANPQSVEELIQTGRAALGVGDADAAVGFFTRAGELAPRDPRVKAGLAAATAQAGHPETALVLFSQAVSLGASEGDIAGDRGLAYDLTGQTARAQQDYLASLRRHEDPEVRRRLALSLAISGEREAALRLLDAQVRGGDRAAARTRAMVLALSGDVAGAANAAQGAVPGGAQAMTPFLSRLASLPPAQMAAAANLGRMPNGGGVIRSTGARDRNGATADPAALAFAGGGSAAPALRGRLPVPPPLQGSSSRRRPGAVEVASRGAAPAAVAPRRTGALAVARTPVAARRAPSLSQVAAPAGVLASAGSIPLGSVPRLPHPGESLNPRLLASAVTIAVVPAPAAVEPTRPETQLAQSSPALNQAAVEAPALAQMAAQASAATDRVEAAPIQFAPDAPAAQPDTEQRAEPEQLVDGAAANLAVWNREVTPASRPSVRVQAAPFQAPAPPVRARFSDVAAAVSALPTETPAAGRAVAGSNAPAPRRAARATITNPRSSASPTTTAAPSRLTATAAATRTAAAPRAGRAAPAAATARIWVQLGVAPSSSGFGYEIGRMRRAAPELFANRTPYTAPIGSSRRLLVGPFASDAEARQFINGLRAKSIQAMSWTSPAGTEVERLTATR